MAILTDLPPELIDQIVSLLAIEEPPSKRSLREEPSLALLTSPRQIIKHLGQACRLLHRVAWPYLFRYLKANIGDVAALIRFAQRRGLSGQVSNILLYSINLKERDSAPQHLLAKSNSNRSHTWDQIRAIVNTLNPMSITLLLPPEDFELMVPFTLRLADDWAFDIRYQILHLEQNPNTPVPPNEWEDGIFTLRQWTHMTFNEGSSVKVYSTYEYFAKHCPTCMYPREDYLPTYPSLLSLDYIAVFPCRRNAFPSLMNCFPNLRHLKLQFHPTLSNAILDNAPALGTVERSDLWSELRKSYFTLFGGATSPNHLKNVNQISIMDYSTAGVAEIIQDITQSLRLNSPWQYEGDGQWRFQDVLGRAEVE